MSLRWVLTHFVGFVMRRLIFIWIVTANGTFSKKLIIIYGVKHIQNLTIIHIFIRILRANTSLGKKKN